MMLLGVVGGSEMYDLNLAGVTSEMGEAICEHFVTMSAPGDEEASYAACSFHRLWPASTP
jgi:hypothetical protein